jgi:FkbH-like protein
VKFLEAHRIVTEFSGGEPLEFLLALSGTGAPLELYVRAHAAKLGRAARVRMLPFSTIQQTLIEPPRPGEREVFLLMPWDLVPALDWRTGIPLHAPEPTAWRNEADQFIQRIATRPGARLVYLPAPVPPVLGLAHRSLEACRWLESRMLSAGARVLPAEAFQLSSYLSSGCPIGGNSLGSVASEIVLAAVRPPRTPMKVLITDLDNVLWSGVIGEDGVDGIAFGPTGMGFKHFLYQSYLAKLQQSGVLLAAVSRNDPEIALAPFATGRMPLQEKAFVCIVASYSAKSSQIRRIAEQLNLGLGSMVFVDDNPIELEEVGAQLPEVTCVPFPTGDDGMPALLERLAELLESEVVTVEDRERTEMYRRRLAGMVPSDAAGGDLTAFLRQLQMKLTIHDRTKGDRARAVQLINKTNQFNLNGRRVSDEEVEAILTGGGRLFTATLTDRHGEHGEILSYLVTGDGVVESFVMSCRVFQRRVEHAFLCWLIDAGFAPSALKFAETARNEPMQQFLRTDGFTVVRPEHVVVDGARFQSSHGDSLDLFAISAALAEDDRVTGVR